MFYLWVEWERFRQSEGVWIIFTELAKLLTLKPNNKHKTWVSSNFYIHNYIIMAKWFVISPLMNGGIDLNLLLNSCDTHQANELPVQPAENVWPLLWLRPENAEPGHENGRGLLIKWRLDVLDLGLCVSPTRCDNRKNRFVKNEWRTNWTLKNLGYWKSYSELKLHTYLFWATTNTNSTWKLEISWL